MTALAGPRTDDPGRLVAHRGASGAAPENTLAAIRLAAAEGAGWVEVDVSVLGDGTPVLHHDADLGRTVAGAGPLSALSAEALAGLDAGGWFDPAFAGEPVPTLEAALDLVEDLGLHVNLELKPQDARADRLAETLAGALARRPALGRRVLVSSFDHAALRVLRDHAPGLPLAPLWHRLPADWRETVRALDAGAVHLGARWASAEIVAAIAGHGLDVRLFTVNDPDAAAPMRAAGLTGLFTDHVPRVLAAPGWAAWARTPRG